METTILEREIAKKYQRITGQLPIGLVDTLRILCSPDMQELTAKYLEESRK